MGTHATGRRERNKLQTRARLLEAARHLLNADDSAATVEQIADRAEVSRATFFNYFPSKDDLMTALYGEHIEAFTAKVDEVLAIDMTTRDRILAIFTDFIRESTVLPRYMRAFTGEIERISSSAPEVLAQRGNEFMHQIERVLVAGAEQNELRADYDIDFLCRMVAAIYLSSIRYWAQDPRFDLAQSFAEAGRFAAESVTR
ncbi:TetR/AcrR family transcriptional regulator [Gordonia sp. ABSL1-1]|uniref:TetR/AcrR family transcriptional regulator n=1 Tax=Gordonia sp. ABSL1-1 TaxID=3053923 RepID=UPI002572ADB7|nr:TetR/AcrR family transcriptional regulator [Gordonia sp. ABSL1-1]MDL9935961.1 TetR/AcrR family transcriptional regulator [Gordonia sp. ABSL1-1]